jgi:DNA helicase II / ATP-dependent DNA helicase PcrA
MSEIKLSKAQQEAVDHIQGALLVVASAGSGKTRVLTERIKKLLTITRRKVLAITFTNKAGQEMQERLEGVEDLKSRTFIGTVHGFCQHVIEQRSNLVGFSTPPQIFEDEADRMSLLEQALSNTPTYWARYKELDSKKQKDFRYRALDFISRVKRSLQEPDQIDEADKNEDVILMYNSYQDILKSQGAIDFDDLILLTYQLFAEFPHISALYRREYEFICIDEAQDLNNAQYQLVRAIAGNEYKNVMMVGDPNQSIFAFTGSSAEYMTTDFKRDFTPRVIELRENYRSSRKVIEAALKIVPNSASTENLVITGEFILTSYVDEQEEANAIAEKIQNLLLMKTHQDIEGEITSDKIAILARNKYLFQPIQEVLLANGTPFYYKVTPGALQFESRVMKVFDLALKVRLNPQGLLHRQKLIKECGCSTIHDLSEIQKISLSDGLNSVIEAVCKLSNDGANLREAMKVLKEDLSLDTDGADNADMKVLVNNEIDELLKHWNTYKKNNDNATLMQFKNAMALGQTHSLTTPNGITLSTVHTMKGQEKEIVLLIGMDEGTFPDYRAVQKGGIELEQEKNNAYVAFTRAKRFLYVSFPRQRTMPWGSISTRRVSRYVEPFLKDN